MRLLQSRVGKRKYNMTQKFSTNRALLELYLTTKSTQTAFAASMNVDKQNLHSWLKHKNEMKLSTLQRACSCIGYKVTVKIEKI